MRPYVDEEKCIGCGTCESVCPTEPNVFRVDEKSIVIHPEACTECGDCVESCPEEAIVLNV